MSRFTLPDSNGAPGTRRSWIAIGALLAGSLLAPGAGAAERATLLRYSVPVPAQWQPQTPASNVTVVDLSGTYARGVGGIDGAPKPNQKLLAALVEAPEGNVIFQLHGDGATVEANRPAFFHMIHGWKP